MNKTAVNRSLLFVTLLLLVVPNMVMATVHFELVDAGATGITGYSRSYDVIASRIDLAGLKTAEMIITTAEAGSIYQNSLTADSPGEAYDTFVTIGTLASPLGPNPADTHIDGGAVELGGGPGATFTNQNIDLSWSAEPGTVTAGAGSGTTRVARITVADWAVGSYTITGFEGLGIPGDTLVGTFAPAQMSLSIVEVAGAPTGYTSFDFRAAVNTNMGVMQLMLDTDTAGDIYQNSLVADDAAEDNDTYVTIGSPTTGEQPANTRLIGGAIELGGSVAATFTNQNIDIAWAPEEGIQTSHGVFQIARVTLKNGTSNNPWSLKGWQGGFETGVTISGNISLLPPLPGDVNDDGFIGPDDLTTIINNWGLSGATREQGDLNGNGVVDGPDYAEVLSFWAPTEPPEATPEPATLVLLSLSGLAMLLRRRENR